MDRDYIRLVVYYLYTLRVYSGSQQTRYIVSIVAAPENLTVTTLFASEGIADPCLKVLLMCALTNVCILLAEAA